LGLYKILDVFLTLMYRAYDLQLADAMNDLQEQVG